MVIIDATNINSQMSMHCLQQNTTEYYETIIQLFAI